MLSRKYYKKIADILAHHEPEKETGLTVNPWTIWNNMVQSLADLFQDDNERFDRQRFTEACRNEEIQERKDATNVVNALKHMKGD